MDIPRHELLNIPLFKTELFLPKYKAIEKENWCIKHMKLGFDHGYFSGVWAVEKMPILMRRSKENIEKWEAWMSICPHELESQELCCKYAYGNVVIMGLGMGWVAINTAFNPRVEKVIVIEIDSEVMEIFEESGALTDVPEEIQNKIKIVEADALKWKPDNINIDFLYVDIWKNLVEPQTIDDVRKMQHNINAEKIYFWGQELFLFKEFSDTGLKECEMSYYFLTNAIKKMSLPVFMPEDCDYPAMVINAGKERIKRKLPLVR